MSKFAKIFDLKPEHRAAIERSIKQQDGYQVKAISFKHEKKLPVNPKDAAIMLTTLLRHAGFSDRQIAAVGRSMPQNGQQAARLLAG